MGRRGGRACRVTPTPHIPPERVDYAAPHAAPRAHTHTPHTPRLATAHAHPSTRAGGALDAFLVPSHDGRFITTPDGDAHPTRSTPPPARVAAARAARTACRRSGDGTCAGGRDEERLRLYHHTLRLRTHTPAPLHHYLPTSTTHHHTTHHTFPRRGPDLMG